MKKLFLLAAFVGFGSTVSMAQSESSYQKEIGTNTSLILEGLINTGGAPFNLMYKKVQSERSALRIGVNYHVHSRSEEVVGSNARSSFGSTHFAFSFGKEFLAPVANKWMVYYGGDVVPGFSSSSNKTYIDNLIRSQSSNTTLSANLRPFLGLRFNISERLYLATEASASLFLSQRKEKSISYVDGLVDDENTRNINGFSSGLNAMSGIYVFYRF
jgi:hypothetical protein